MRCLRERAEEALNYQVLQRGLRAAKRSLCLTTPDQGEGYVRKPVEQHCAEPTPAVRQALSICTGCHAAGVGSVQCFSTSITNQQID